MHPARLWKGFVVRHFKKLPVTLLVLLLLSSAVAGARTRTAPRVLTPDKVGEFKAAGAPYSSLAPGGAQGVEPVRPDIAEAYGVTQRAGRDYAGPNGERISAHLVHTTSPAAAYSLLRRDAATAGASGVRTVAGLGLQGFESDRLLTFIKGSTLVRVRADEPFSREAGLTLARGIAERIEGEANYIPILILHLPEWEKKLDEGIGFVVTPGALREVAGERPVFDALSFEGGAEAATAAYGNARLVVVEFSTPQHSVEADALVNERIAQLAAAGQPVPSFYQRVGNYSVFVFDAAGEAAARKLASGVRYEKDVRWLGRNPREGEKVEQYVTQTMGGAIVTALLTTGAAILVSLGVGGLIGGAIFAYRRSRPGAQESYSDAGGMMRLNLEDFDPAGGTAKMLGPKQD
jgi:hypothetical protein